MSARPVAPPEGPRYVGIDVGSVSVKTAVVDSGGALLGAWYRRHRGHPLSVMEGMLRELLAATQPDAAFSNIAVQFDPPPGS